MKKYYWLFLVLSLIARATADYNFDLICRTDTIQQVEPNGVGLFTFTLTNTGTEPDVYELNCVVISIVPDWSVVYCLRGRCLEPGNPMFDSLLSGEADTSIDITVYTSSTPGEAIVVLTVRSLGNPSLNKAITTRTIAAGAITEGRAETGFFSFHCHRLINRRQGLIVLDQGGGLFDISGRRVLQLKPGANSLSTLAPGIYLFNRGRIWLRLLLI